MSSAGVYTAGATGSSSDVVTVTDSLGNIGTVTISVGAGVTITPTAPSAAPKETLSLSASGGSGTGFVWTLSTDGSGASVSSAGVYTAGATGSSSDVVMVTDSLGNASTVTISVGAGVTPNPLTATLRPMESLALSASGGSGSGFVWTFVTNASGGTLTSAGTYKAGPAGNSTDTVTVTDSFGNTASVILEVGPSVTITSATPPIVRGGTLSFNATGGSGTYTWSIPTNNSGATINASTGAYTAGATAGTSDVVKATDTLGNSATATVTIRPLPALASLTPSSGAPAGGNTIALNGTDFDQVTTVEVGGTPVSFTRVSANRLEVVAPAGTGAINVTLNAGTGLLYGYDLIVTAGAHTLDTTTGFFDGAAVDGLTNGMWNVGSFTLSAGATVTVTGNSALIINSTNNAIIHGSILAVGGDGGDGTRAPGAEGSAGPGGFAGGRGGTAPPDGARAGEGPGGAPGGTVSGLGGTTISSGGGGAGHKVAGTQVTGGAAAGPAYGAANDIPNVLVGGSGGGGGGRSPGAPSQGGGGGGGGGAIRIIARNSLALGSTATLDVHGGSGGNGSPSTGSGASGGGGGSGGSVWLSAGVTSSIDGAASILLSGGAGGLAVIGDALYTATDGGAGSVGTLVVQP